MCLDIDVTVLRRCMESACELLNADASSSAVDGWLRDPDVQRVLNEVLEALTRPGVDPDLAEDDSPVVDSSRPPFFNRVYRFFSTFTENPLIAGLHITSVVMGTVTGYFLIQSYGGQLASAAYRALRLAQFVQGIRLIITRIARNRAQQQAAEDLERARQQHRAPRPGQAVPLLPTPPDTTPMRHGVGRRRVRLSNLTADQPSTSIGQPQSSTPRTRSTGFRQFRPSLADISSGDETSEGEDGDQPPAYEPWRTQPSVLSSDEVNFILNFHCFSYICTYCIKILVYLN